MSDPNEYIETIKKLFGNIRVQDVMNPNVVTAQESEDLSEVHTKFMNNRVNHTVVVDRSKRVVGLLSRKYLYKAQSPRRIMGEGIEYQPDIIIDGDSFYMKEVLDDLILSNIMKQDPFVMSPDQPFSEAVVEMQKRYIACIPVVDEDRVPVGMVCDMDIVKLISGILNS